MATKTFNEFPGVKIPGFLADWEDTSWGNDALASCERAEKSVSGNTVIAWVNHDRVEKREPGLENFKFFIELRNTETGDEIETIPADDEETALAAIATLILK